MDEWILAHHQVQGMTEDSPVFNSFESHSLYEIYLFVAGECKYLINNRIYDLQPGDIILLDGLTLHKPITSSPDTYERSMIHFSPTRLNEILNVLGIPYLLNSFKGLNNCLIRTGFDESGHYVNERIKWLADMLDKIDIEFQRTNKKNDILESEVKLELVQLLLKIYKLSQNEQTQIKKKTEKQIHTENIVSWIDNHYSEKINLDLIASELNLSKYYVSHVFKEITGFTVMQYVMECRFIQIKYLLEMEPIHSLTEVAQSCGFESVAHFSRFFKARMGITASQYRKIMNKRSVNY